MQDAYLRGIRYVSYAAVFLACGILIYATPFVRLWLPPEFGDTARVMAILAVGSAFFLPQIIGNSVLFGLEKHRYLLGALGSEAVLKLALSLALIGSYGAAGMAAATTTAQVVTCMTIYPYVMSRVLNLQMGRLLLTQAKHGLLAAVVTIPVAVLISRLLPPDNWPLLFVNVGVVTVATVIVGIGVVMESADRRRILEVVTNRRGKSRPK